MPEYVELTSQDAAIAQALQAQFDAGLSAPQAAATADENPNSSQPSQAQFPPLSEPAFQPAPTRSSKHNKASAQSSAQSILCAMATAPDQQLLHSQNPFAVLDRDLDQPSSRSKTPSDITSKAGSPHPDANASSKPNAIADMQNDPASAADAVNDSTSLSPAASQLASLPAAISTDPALLVINPPADPKPLASSTSFPRSNGPAAAADAVNDSSISPSTSAQAGLAAGGAIATHGAAMSADVATGTTTTGSVPSSGADLHEGAGIGRGSHDGAGSARADNGGADNVAGVGGAGFGGADNGGAGISDAAGAPVLAGPNCPHYQEAMQQVGLTCFTCICSDTQGCSSSRPIW